VQTFERNLGDLLDEAKRLRDCGASFAETRVRTCNRHNHRVWYIRLYCALTIVRTQTELEFEKGTAPCVEGTCVATTLALLEEAQVLVRLRIGIITVEQVLANIEHSISVAAAGGLFTGRSSSMLGPVDQHLLVRVATSPSIWAIISRC